MSKQSHLYTILVHRVSTIFIDQISTYLLFKSTFCAGIRIFNSWPCNLTFLKNEKTKFKVALKKYLNTHCLYSVDEFCMCKGDPVFFKMFIVFYIVNILIICILMTCSTSCCLCKHWSMECTYVCMHVCRSKTVSCNNQTAFH